MKSVYDYLTERVSQTKASSLIQDPEIVQASYDGDLEKVQELLNKGVDPNSMDSQGRTAIMRWQSGDDKDILELLLKAGADINHKDKDGNTILHEVAHNADEEEIKYLLSKGADKTVVGRTGLSSTVAYDNENYDIMDELKTNESVAELLKGIMYYGSKIHSENDKEVIFETDIGDIGSLYKESRNEGVSKEKFIEIITGGLGFDDYDVGDWNNYMDSIDGENMERIKKYAEENGYDSEDDLEEFLEDTEVPSAIMNAMESAQRDEELAYIQKQIDENLKEAGITIDYDIHKALIAFDKDDVWYKFKQGDAEVFPEIEPVYYSRYGSGWDDKNFNSILKDMLNDYI